MTTELFSLELLNKILVRIPENLEEYLAVKRGEPNTLQLLKLLICAFFNNILRCQFLDLHGNNYLKALWLLQNRERSMKVFRQYNYMEMYPFVDDEGNLPSFLTLFKKPSDTIGRWNDMQEKLPILYIATNAIFQAVQIQKDDVLSALKQMADNRKKDDGNFSTLSKNRMKSIKEQSNIVDTIVNTFVPFKENKNTYNILQRDDEGLILTMNDD